MRYPSIPIQLESPPPDQLGDGSALATPYSVVAIPDTSWIAGTAAGSDEVFIVDASQQTLLSRHSVGATPRGITSLTLAGKPSLWTYNAVDNSISRLSIEEDASLTPCTDDCIAGSETRNAQTRMAFVRVRAHLNHWNLFLLELPCWRHTDQLIWVLDTPNAMLRVAIKYSLA